MYKYLFTLISFSCILLNVSAQEEFSVFKIGEQSDLYENLCAEYSAPMMEVYSFSMEESYNEWITLMEGFESYCKKASFDLHGVKLWINVFWNKDGYIQHLVFHEKPNSKLLNYDSLRQLFKDYVVLSPKGASYNKPYAHHGSISFPVIRPSQKTTVK